MKHTKNNSPLNKKYLFLGKALLFPKEKILVIGDLHLGYEEKLRKQGLAIPLNQLQEVKEEIRAIFKNIKARGIKIEKIVFIGDIKHGFGPDYEEKKQINDLIGFIRKDLKIKMQNLIFIRGNHEKNSPEGYYCDYYIEKDIAFVHGHKDYAEIYDKNINLIVMGHLHPTVTLRDGMKVKAEKYKCFLVGRYKKKDFVVMPSFLNITEGVSANEFDDYIGGGFDFSIVPNKELPGFEVFICQDLDNALDFGKLRGL